MSDETKTQIANIYSSAQQILCIYNLLKRLELMNKENTHEYKSLIKVLNLTIIAEKSLYDYFIQNPSEVIYLVKHIIEDTIHLDDCNNIDLIIEQDPEDLISMRIKNRINNRIVNVDYNPHFDQIVTNNDNLKEFIQVLNDTTDIRMIDFLEQNSSEEKHKDLRNYLLSAKLYLSYLNEKIEEINLINNFDHIPNKFNQELEFNTSDKSKITDMKNLHGELLLLQAFEEIGYYDNEDLNAPVVYGKCLICAGLIQNSLLYFSKQQAKMVKITLDNEIEEIKELRKSSDEEKYIIKELIDSDESLEEFDEDKYFIEEIIEDAFSSIDKIKKNANSDLPKEKSL